MVLRPTVTVFAGPNGSGKSTLKRKLEEQGVEFPNYLNADDYAVGIALDNPDRSRAAQIWVREQRDLFLSIAESYTFETVMSHVSHIDHLKAAKAGGYLVQLIFIGLEKPELNTLRVWERVSGGGHDVPEDRIIARYRRTMALLPDALAVADTARVFDNSDSAAPFRLIAKKEKSELAIYPDDGDVPDWFAAAIAALEALYQIQEE